MKTPRKVKLQRGMVLKNLVILILTSTLAMGVVNRVISRQNAPNNEIKEKANFKNEKRGKVKKAYVAWDDNEVSSSSSFDDEEANFCLRAYVSSRMSSSSSIKGNNYYQLLEAFNETHEEANRLAISHNRLKGINKQAGKQSQVS